MAKTFRETQAGSKTALEMREDAHEGVANFIVDVVTEGNQISIKKLAEKHGIAPMTARSIEQRLNSKYLPVAQKIKEYSVPNMIRGMDNLAVEIINSIDKETIEKATLNQRVVSAAILTDKSQLLKGQPTEILSVEDRRALPDLVQALTEEAARREMEVNITPDITVIEQSTKVRKTREYVRKS